MRKPDERMLFRVTEPVEAELLVRTPSGTRPPTIEDIHQCRLLDEDTLYRRRCEVLKRLFGETWTQMVDKDDRISGLRYLFEYLGSYAHLDLPDEAVATLAAILNGR